ncbi:Hypothetical predicted protein [Olea europaea subsp. europaea]|uniref:Uncharacterized protein n=1 Tax=Olea europaea subsp. europaea TaxID=158383 RepID=A0A8S0QYG9_OLEEU|nr:Hypothetical predicted protein [Olea europaea subsp. europaea]
MLGYKASKVAKVAKKAQKRKSIVVEKSQHELIKKSLSEDHARSELVLKSPIRQILFEEKKKSKKIGRVSEGTEFGIVVPKETVEIEIWRYSAIGGKLRRLVPKEGQKRRRDEVKALRIWGEKANERAATEKKRAKEERARSDRDKLDLEDVDFRKVKQLSYGVNHLRLTP